MRLHPLSIPYRAAHTVARLAWVLVLASVGSASAGVPPRVVALVVVAGLALALGYQVLYYRRFAYHLGEETIDIRSGVLSRRHREIPYRRVQNVDVGRNAVQRGLGIAEVRVETAGGGETEVVLRFVGDAAARRIREEIGRRTAEEGDLEAAAEPAPLFAISRRELALLGAVSLDLRFASGLFVVVSLVSPSLAGRLVPSLREAAIVAAPLALLGVYAVAAVASGAVAVANYYGFRLRRVGDELRYERGLVQRYSGTIPLEKVQTLTVEANLLARALGYARLVVETAGYGPDDGRRAAAVPIAGRERVQVLARRIEPFGELDFERPPGRARTRYAIRYALGLVGIALGGLLVDRTTSLALAWYLPLVALPLAPVAAHCKWRHRGYLLAPDHVVTRNGFWVETVQIVPYHRVQTVTTAATAFQRRRRLATLAVDTAGSRSRGAGQPRAVDFDAAVAADGREAIAARLQASLRERGGRPRLLDRSGPGTAGRDPAPG